MFEPTLKIKNISVFNFNKNINKQQLAGVFGARGGRALRYSYSSTLLSVFACIVKPLFLNTPLLWSTCYTERSQVPTRDFCWFWPSPIWNPRDSECERFLSVPITDVDLNEVNRNTQRYLSIGMNSKYHWLILWLVGEKQRKLWRIDKIDLVFKMNDCCLPNFQLQSKRANVFLDSNSSKQPQIIDYFKPVSQVPGKDLGT